MECLQTQSELGDMNQGLSCCEDSKTPLGFASRWLGKGGNLNRKCYNGEFVVLHGRISERGGNNVQGNDQICDSIRIQRKFLEHCFSKRCSMKKKLFVFL